MPCKPSAHASAAPVGAPPRPCEQRVAHQFETALPRSQKKTHRKGDTYLARNLHWSAHCLPAHGWCMGHASGVGTACATDTPELHL